MESFEGVAMFDQNVVSYLELLRVPYTGCNPRGLMLSRDKALSKTLLAYHRIPVPEFAVFRVGRADAAAQAPEIPADRQVGDAGVVDRHFASVGGRKRRQAARARRASSITASAPTPSSSATSTAASSMCGVLGNLKLQVFPVWELLFKKMSDENWRIATERVKWSDTYQKKHGITSALAERSA